MANFPALVLGNRKSKNAGKAEYTTASGTNLQDWTGMVELQQELAL
jgi:hypothetical protein